MLTTPCWLARPSVADQENDLDLPIASVDYRMEHLDCQFERPSLLDNDLLDIGLVAHVAMADFLGRVLVDTPSNKSNGRVRSKR